MGIKPKITVYGTEEQGYPALIIEASQCLVDIMQRFNFYIHESLGEGGEAGWYTISEGRSGGMVAAGPTKDKALATARKKLKSVSDKQFNEMIEKIISDRREYYKKVELDPLWAIMHDAGHTLLESELHGLYRIINDNGYKLVKICEENSN